MKRIRPWRLSEAGRRALRSAAETGDPTSHLRGQAEHGGFSGTRISLRAHGLLDHQNKITEAGRAALAATEGRKPWRGR